MDIIEEKTIDLRKVVKIGRGDAAVEYVQLKLREPTLGELRKASKAGNGLDSLATLIQQVAAVPASVVDSLCQRDMEECDAFFAQFSGSAFSQSTQTEEKA